MKLKLTNSLTNEIHEMEVIEKGSSMNFYKIEFVLPYGIKDGQYEYELMEGSLVLSKGLLQIGNLNIENNKEYKNEQKTIVYGE